MQGILIYFDANDIIVNVPMPVKRYALQLINFSHDVMMNEEAKLLRKIWALEKNNGLLYSLFYNCGSFEKGTWDKFLQCFLTTLTIRPC